MPSIGRKLTFSYVLISLITVLIMEALFFMAIYQYYVSGMSQTLINHAEASATMFEKYSPTGSIDDKLNFIYENMKLDEPALVEIYDTNQQFLINNIGNNKNNTEISPDYNEALKGDTAIWHGRLKTHEPVISVSVPIKNRDKVVGIVRYVSSMTIAENILRVNMTMAIIIGLIILLVAALLGYVMSNRILVPIKDLIRVTKEITGGNYDVIAKQYYKDEIGQLANAVNQMTEEIGRSDKAKSDFISSVSHELRTPLTSIKGWSETIDDNIHDTETAKLGISIIDRETNRLIHLVNDLLDFSRLQGQRIVLDYEIISVDDFLCNLYEQFLARSVQENISIRLSSINSLNALVYGDINRLKQVFINILDNAFKFVIVKNFPEVIISAHMLDDQVVVTVEDNGPGMTSEELVRVKEKFYKGSSKQSGSGLGLSIANEIVELHKGTLYIDSIRGIGTKVSIVLPLLLDETYDTTESR